MIVIKNGQKLQVVLAGAITTNNLQCFAVWRNITASAYTADSNPVATNSTTDVDLIGDPGAAGTQNIADYISVYNADTVSATVTFKIDVSGTEKIIHTATLGVGEKVEYVDGAGWRKYNAAGTLIEATSGGPTDVQSAAVAGAGTWTKPTSFTPTFVRVILYGAGGGGGGGGAAGTSGPTPTAGSAGTNGTLYRGGYGGGGGGSTVTANTNGMAGGNGGTHGGGGGGGGSGSNTGTGGAGGVGGSGAIYVISW